MAKVNPEKPMDFQGVTLEISGSFTATSSGQTIYLNKEATVVGSSPHDYAWTEVTMRPMALH